MLADPFVFRGGGAGYRVHPTLAQIFHQGPISGVEKLDLNGGYQAPTSLPVCYPNPLVEYAFKLLPRHSMQVGWVAHPKRD